MQGKFTGLAWIVGETDFVLKTTSWGLSWTPKNIGYSSIFTSITYPATGGNSRGWITDYYSNDRIFYSTDQCETWFPQQTGIQGGWLASFQYCCNGTGWIVGGGLAKTTNFGLAWFQQTIPSNFYWGMHFPSESTGWIVGENGQSAGVIYKTTNGGTNWFSQPSGINTPLWSVFFVNDYTGWAVGPYGVILKTTTGGLTGINEISEEPPSEFKLHQNYPNPFNAQTRFRIEVRKTAKVKVVVSDVLGGKVETVMDKEVKPGMYEINLDGSNYPSGVYFYRMFAGEFTEARRMVVIK
jgi:hypothetical protein